MVQENGPEPQVPGHFLVPNMILIVMCDTAVAGAKLSFVSR
jgi:hypothetical protein